MVIVYLFASLIGGAATAIWLWSDSALLAIAAAPFGGSAAVLTVAILVTHWRIRNIGYRATDPGEPEPIYLRRRG
jgi:hypothetical protein